MWNRQQDKSLRLVLRRVVGQTRQQPCEWNSQPENRSWPRPAGRPRAASPVCFSGLCVSAWNFQLQAAGSTSHEPSGRPHRTFMPLHLKSVLTGAESRHILVMPTFSVVTKRIRSRMLKEVGR
jgi:hypothetical protein